MEIQEYLNSHKKIYEVIHEFLTNEEEPESSNELKHIFKSLGDMNEKEEIRSFLRLISKISKSHHRYPSFFNKIEQILQHYFTEIKQNFSSSEVFQIFRKSKRILYFLFKEKIIAVDEDILQIINDKIKLKPNFYTQYKLYFYPEFKDFLDEKDKESIEYELSKFDIHTNFELFETRRKEGENEDTLCEMIRQDSAESFISYINHNKISPNKTTIKPSLFETNSFLIDKEPSLIEYAAFYGSIQIVQYLIFSKVELNESLWLYTIHSKNAELIHLLEENKINHSNNFSLLEESIKCHHNDITEYIINGMMNDGNKIFDNPTNFNENVYNYGFKYINYNYLPKDFDHKFTFFYLCQYDYLTLVKLYMQYNNVDLEEKIILYSLFYSQKSNF